jgi:hypothetical protein
MHSVLKKCVVFAAGIAGTLPADRLLAGDGVPFAVAAAGAAVKELDASMKELSRLRELIGGERLPLSKRLSQLEDEIIEARREYDRLRKSGDCRLLHLNALKKDV